MCCCAPYDRDDVLKNAVLGPLRLGMREVIRIPPAPGRAWVKVSPAGVIAGPRLLDVERASACRDVAGLFDRSAESTRTAQRDDPSTRHSR